MSSPKPAGDRPVRTVPGPASGSAATTAPSATGDDAEGPGATTAQLARFGRRYPATGRAVVAVLCAATAPFAAPPAGPALAAAVAVGVVGWNAAHLALVLPDGRSPRLLTALCGVDLVVMCGLCLAQPLLVDPTLLVRSLGWVSPVASFTVVAVQFTLRPPSAAAATAAVCLAFVAGTAASPGLTAADGLLAGGAWMVVEALLARLLWRLLRRGGAEADRLLAARFAAERAAATAAARRADQRAHWATVHDTSASTLLMIGLGEVGGAEEWLPGQLDRDIGLLDGRREVEAGPVDLGSTLRAVADRSRLQVACTLPAGVTVPSAVAAALSGAVTEALENVRRHAGTGAATLVVRVVEVGVEVEVGDRGRGFDPADVGPRRLGLAWSVHDRMDAVGGRVTVESAAGEGTVVRLGWPR